MSAKTVLAVLFGGKSSEYEVSLSSAYAVLSNVDGEKYDLVKIGITRSGEWYLYEGPLDAIARDGVEGTFVKVPFPRSRNADLHKVVLFPVHVGKHGVSRGQRHLVFRGFAAEKNGQNSFCTHSIVTFCQ